MFWLLDAYQSKEPSDLNVSSIGSFLLYATKYILHYYIISTIQSEDLVQVFSLHYRVDIAG